MKGYAVRVKGLGLWVKGRNMFASYVHTFIQFYGLRVRVKS